MPHAALMMFPCAEVLRRFPSRSFPLDRSDLRLHSCRNRVGNLILDGENVLHWSIVSLGPNMSAAFVHAAIDAMGVSPELSAEEPRPGQLLEAAPQAGQGALPAQG